MRKWLALVVPVVLLVTGGSRLVAGGAANLGNLELVPHLAQVLPAFELPDCEHRVDVPVARQLLEQTGSRRAGVLFSRGWAAWLEGRCSRAEALWGQACAMESTSRQVPSCLWLSLVTQGAMGGVSDSVPKRALLTGYATKFGLWAKRADAQEAARFAFWFSLELGPSRLAARRLTILLRSEQRYDDALEVWQEMAAALPPEEPDHWWALGRAAELREDRAQAAEAFGRGARLSDAPYDFWFEQGRNFERLQDWEWARKAYWRASLSGGVQAAPYVAVGNTYLQQEQYAYARDWLSIALGLNPNDVSANYHLAQVLHRLGEGEAAAAFLGRAVELHPDQRWSWAVQLGDWRLALGDREGALESYNQALIWRPGEILIEERIEQLTEGES